MEEKITLDFLKIRERLKSCPLPEVDRVVGIGTGGIVPAALVAYELNRPLTILSINYRAPDNSPRYDEPKLLGELVLSEEPERILLVDDVSVSGQTLALAKEILIDHKVITLVVKGKADIVLFSEIAQCVNWPWKD